MKSLLRISILFLTIAFCAAQTPEDKWKAVTEAQEKGRPKSAIEALEPILATAKAEKRWAEAVKAFSLKISFEGQIQGQKAEEKITRLQGEIKNWPKDSHPILETVLTHWYWQFFQQNRWRFMNRTQTAGPQGDDILSWDLSRILAEIDKHFTAALADPEKLQAVPISDYDDLLKKGSVPDSFRPTLYDFIAHEALRFYTTGEQAGNKSQDDFEFSADSPAFGTIDQFLAWKPGTTDTDSLKLRAIQLFQGVLRFHKDDDAPDARIDTDLARLEFAKNTAFGESKDDRYAAALERFINDWGDHRISARARANWANLIRGQGEEADLVKAHKIAKQGAEAFPNTPGGALCHNIVEEIEQPQVKSTVERVWNAPWPKIQVNYKNVEKVYFRIFAYNWRDLLGSGHYNFEGLYKEKAVPLMKGGSVKDWSVDLPATADYHMRVEEIEVPKDLEAGFYFIFSSHDPDFTKQRANVTSISPFWVSDLALITRIVSGSGEIGGFVLDAVTGEPVEGAQVVGWKRGRLHKREKLKMVTTNADGLFKIATKNRNWEQLVILAEHQGRAVSTIHDAGIIYHEPRKPKPYLRTYFFTDRSLYRPGQTINYKGLTVRVDQYKDDYETVANKNVSVVFQDRNGKEIARQSHRSNDYGSFHGSFTAPRDRLMGRMSIIAERDALGRTSVTVEEYKRPKFKVTLNAPKEAAKLDGGVKLVGKAESYTGAAVDGAEVTYRVVREVRYPQWWWWHCWWMPPNQDGSQEIAHGKARTAIDGTFDITFEALPDRTVAKEAEPTFRYTVYADVTDLTGETRSDQKVVNLGYTALKASLSAADWQQRGKEVEITVSTQTLDGEGQGAKGKIKLHKLQEPEKVQRTSLGGQHRPWYPRGKDPKPDPANPNSWELGDLVGERDFQTNGAGTVELKFDLEPGIYRALLETQDAFQNPVTAMLGMKVVDVDATNFPLKLANFVAAPKWSVEPGSEFTALWGTGYDEGRAYLEVEHRGKLLLSTWSKAGDTQAGVKLPVTEAMRGGFTLRVTQVRENRAYFTQRKVDVPWTNKQLEVKWAHHTSKLEPGQKETWTATVTGPNAEKAVAEMAAALYDESLDAYLPHRWMEAFSVFRQDKSNLRSQFQNRINNFNQFLGSWPRHFKSHDLRYRAFPPEMMQTRGDSSFSLFGDGRMMKMSAKSMDEDEDGFASGALDMEATAAVAQSSIRASAAHADPGQGGGVAATAAGPKPNLDQVTARKNLQETAFFFPNLVTKEDGSVDLEFTMPEALTKWKFFAFAHDKQLRSGFLSDSVVTSKDIMVQPNPPRFLREGDELEFTVKVVNLSATRQTGVVRLGMSDARTAKSVDSQLKNTAGDQDFDIPAKESRTFSWKLSVPDGQGFLIYKAVASTGKLSDGEEGYLPVLPRRILVTESLPLPIRDAQTKKFEFSKLLDSAKSDSLKHESLTVQMVSNPSWYAVMALPYLMEYPHQCSEQIFNRLYANALARHIAESDPKIKRVFEQWRGTDALDSPLEKNEDLKAVALEETPWVRQGEKESQARKNVGILFEQNRLNFELAKAQRQLAERQLRDGGWAWFPGGRPNDYITLYITTGYGRLRHLGLKKVDMAPAVKALGRLDSWIDKRYRRIVTHGDKEANNLSPSVALYLYCRSFYLQDRKIAPNHKEAVDYFLGQAKEHWPKVGSRQSKAHLALGLTRFGVHKETPKDIMVSLKEHAVTNEEMGMFWRDTEFSYWWYRAPVETQAMMIEAFDEVAKDHAAVEDLKVWMLKQKQTQDWKTTKATADAVYALLLRSTDLLASDELVSVSLGQMAIEPEKVEAGTGFYEQKLFRTEVKPNLGTVTVSKTDPGVAWGSVHWQYFESMEKITPHESTPLTLKKKLFTKVNTKAGPVLKAVKAGDSLKVGDELVVRIELRSDRDMEYLHLKDQRGSGTEPVNVLSRYRYQDGLGYYESTRDTASHFFIDYMPKGTYVFEYSVRVRHRGAYQSGMANIQCMYAPEFNSHSESFAMKVE